MQPLLEISSIAPTPVSNDKCGPSQIVSLDSFLVHAVIDLYHAMFSGGLSGTCIDDARHQRRCSSFERA